jgi:type VI secretion system protein ImpE
MMQAKELLDAGQLTAAIAHLTQEVRSHPGDTRQRIFLFELLCFAGDYPRAVRQLDVIGHQNAAMAVGVQVYRNVLVAEEARQRLFAEGPCPDLLFDPPPYVSLHLTALQRLRQEQWDEARSLLEESERTRPPVRGRVDGQPCGDFRDADDLLAPCLEVIVRGHYIWLPFAQIRSLRIAPPKRLRDLLWASATIESPLGPVGEVYLPVLYVGSSTHVDERVRLGRMTDWQNLNAGLVRGVGQRLFLADGEEKAMLEVREIAFEVESPGVHE